MKVGATGAAGASAMRGLRRPGVEERDTGGAIRVLRSQGMPAAEIRAVLSADDPRIVRRYLELHRERLEERLAAQRRVLEDVGRVLSAAADRRVLRQEEPSPGRAAG